MNRRHFLISSFALAASAAASTAAYGALFEPGSLKITDYDLATAKWPAGASPLRIAIAADLHVGCPSVNLARVEKIAARLNDMKPDVILLLGDYLCGKVALGEYVPPREVAAALKGLNAPGGVHAVLGNHDWYRDGKGMWKALENNGIQVYENHAVKIKGLPQPFWIAGVADDRTRHPNLAKTFAKVTDNDPVILMAHDPATFLETPERPVVTLAGHTHGGQVRLPFCGPAYIPTRAPLRYAYGHINEDNRDLIVSAGIGTSRYPVRFNAPPELVSLVIRPAAP